jgi:hypothetical protein
MVGEFSVPFITWQVVDRLLILLRECRRQGIPEPYVYPNGGGGVQLEWRFDDRNGPELELLNANRVTYFDPEVDPPDVRSIPFDAPSIIGEIGKVYMDGK